MKIIYCSVINDTPFLPFFSIVRQCFLHFWQWLGVGGGIIATWAGRRVNNGRHGPKTRRMHTCTMNYSPLQGSRVTTFKRTSQQKLHDPLVFGKLFANLTTKILRISNTKIEQIRNIHIYTEI